MKRPNWMRGRREPDIIIGDPDRPYLLRWHILPRNKWFNGYLHCFLRSDDDRALHDHPWWNLSILLKGSYVEVTDDDQIRYYAGAVKARTGAYRHRIQIDDDTRTWSLFITGPRYREWGFWCPNNRFVHWQKYTAGENHELIGRGCD